MRIEKYMAHDLTQFNKHFNMIKYLLPLILLLLFVQYSCKKTGNPPPILDSTTTPAIPDQVDTVIGIYIGNVKDIREEYNGSTQNPVYTYDTTYYTDTVRITKVSKDSFSVERRWIPYSIYNPNGKFKYGVNSEYKLAYGESGTFGELKMRLYPGNDSVYINLYTKQGPYSAYVKSTKEFWGKK